MLDAAQREPVAADMQQERTLLGLPTDYDPAATSSFDTVSMIAPQVIAQLVGQYVGLKEQGAFNAETAEKAAAEIAPNVRATLTYRTYEVGDLHTTPDTSFDRMLTYRADMRTALAPLLDTKDAELETYARFLETSDDAYLEQLTAAAKRYRAAAEAGAAVVVPRDAVNYHRATLDAMQEFAAVLDALVSYADDPVASVALLRAYNSAEEHMFTSFDSLSSYYGQKTP